MVKLIPSSGMEDVYLYEVLYAYHPEKDNSSDISIDPGDEIRVAAKDAPSSRSKDPTWLFGNNVTKNIQGLFPSNYVKRVQFIQASKPAIPPKPPILQSPSRDQNYMDVDLQLLIGGGNSFLGLASSARKRYSNAIIAGRFFQPPKGLSRRPLGKTSFSDEGVGHHFVDSYFLKPILCFHYVEEAFY